MQSRTEEGSAKELREELERLRASVKTKLHLAGLEARKEWVELESKTKQLQAELKQQGTTTRRALLADATALVRRLRSFIDKNLRSSSARPG